MRVRAIRANMQVIEQVLHERQAAGADMAAKLCERALMAAQTYLAAGQSFRAAMEAAGIEIVGGSAFADPEERMQSKQGKQSKEANETKTTKTTKGSTTGKPVSAATAAVMATMPPPAPAPANRAVQGPNTPAANRARVRAMQQAEADKKAAFSASQAEAAREREQAKKAGDPGKSGTTGKSGKSTATEPEREIAEREIAEDAVEIAPVEQAS